MCYSSEVGLFFFCKQKTAYELRISDWSSDVCSSDLKTYCRDADIAQTENIGPFLPKPVDRFIAIGAFLEVGLRMHDWQTVAAIILTGDLAITENLTGSPGAAVRMDPMFIGPVIVVTKNTVLFQRIAQEEMIFIPRHPIVHQIFVHLAVDPPAIVEIEGKKSRGVQYFGRPDRIRIGKACVSTGRSRCSP